MQELSVFVTAFWLFGCATDGEVRQGVAEPVPASKPLVGAKKADTVQSASIALRLAEVTLQERGIERGDRQAHVSFCDGVYSVTFVDPGGNITAKSFKVDIDASTSRILRVDTSGH